MKLLICTQAVDKNDPLLGFFHRWIEECTTYFEQITVICLKEGEHDFPPTVQVLSLGKETGESRIKYIIGFYRYLFGVRGTYDCVFVHMNPHYVLLGGWYWKLIKVKIFFWRNHARMNLMTRIAAPFAHMIFYTSPFACTSRYAHARQMPVGIDHHLFTPHKSDTSTQNSKKKILFLGRLSPVKHPEVFIESKNFLSNDYELHLYGDDPHTDNKYAESLKRYAREGVFFHGAVRNELTPDIYRSHDIYVNLTPKGSMDKAVLEAVACGVPVIVVNTSFCDVVSPDSILTEATPQKLAEKISEFGTRNTKDLQDELQKARESVIEKHSLEKLGSMLYDYTQKS